MLAILRGASKSGGRVICGCNFSTFALFSLCLLGALLSLHCWVLWHDCKNVLDFHAVDGASQKLTDIIVKILGYREVTNFRVSSRLFAHYH